MTPLKNTTTISKYQHPTMRNHQRTLLQGCGSSLMVGCITEFDSPLNKHCLQNRSKAEDIIRDKGYLRSEILGPNLLIVSNGRIGCFTGVR